MHLTGDISLQTIVCNRLHCRLIIYLSSLNKAGWVMWVTRILQRPRAYFYFLLETWEGVDAAFKNFLLLSPFLQIGEVSYFFSFCLLLVFCLITYLVLYVRVCSRWGSHGQAGQSHGELETCPAAASLGQGLIALEDLKEGILGHGKGRRGSGGGLLLPWGTDNLSHGHHFILSHYKNSNTKTKHSLDLLPVLWHFSLQISFKTYLQKLALP